MFEAFVGLLNKIMTCNKIGLNFKVYMLAA